jgi:hypothetical protein
MVGRTWLLNVVVLAKPRVLVTRPAFVGRERDTTSYLCWPLGVALVRIETPELGDCSQVALFQVNYLDFS